MPEIENLAVFLVAAISLNMTPGPDTLYVLARSVGQGRRAGVVSVLGGSTGRLIHTFATALGLSALLVSSPKAYAVVKLLGAVYLVYLGVRMLFGREERGERAQAGGQSLARIYAQGFATNVLNPAVAAFFISFLPQFVNPERGRSRRRSSSSARCSRRRTLWSLTVALARRHVRQLPRRAPALRRAQRWLTGGILVALGARLAFV